MIRLSRNAVLASLVALLGLGLLVSSLPAADKDTSDKAGPKVKAKPAPKPKAPRTPESALTPAIKDPKRHDNFLAIAKKGNIDLLLLGDSITDGWPGRGKSSYAKLAPCKPADFGISGDRTEHVLWRITNGELEGIAPKVVVIMIGTNNIGHFGDEKPEWAAEGVKKIVQTVREKLPQAKVLLLGVFPRDKKESSMRKKVDAINAIICKLDDGKTVRYLDINAKFLDADGELPADIMPDKLHPSAKGYDIWYDSMKPLLDEMMK